MPDTKDQFNPSRLTLARNRRGLTKSQLASALGVDLRSVSGFESDEYPPSNVTLDRIVRVLGFPRDFYFGDDIDVPESNAVSFRSLSKMTASQRSMALGAGALALLVNRWLEQEFHLPRTDLPDLSREPDPETAAISLRQAWSKGELPIRNVVQLLEAHGVRVFSLAIESREVDAFSHWYGSTPVMFLNTMKSAEHSRFDAAHELGHLVLHRHALGRGRDAETAANNFASAFLMPRSDVLAYAPRFPTIATLVKLKRRWMVSVAALTYRLHQLGATNDWQNRKLCMELSRKGYRTSEPDSVTRETSLVWQKVNASLREEGLSRSQIARELTLPSDELDKLTFGLTITSLQGGRTNRLNGSGRAQLEVVSTE